MSFHAGMTSGAPSGGRSGSIGWYCASGSRASYIVGPAYATSGIGRTLRGRGRITWALRCRSHFAASQAAYPCCRIGVNPLRSAASPDADQPRGGVLDALRAWTARRPAAARTLALGPIDRAWRCARSPRAPKARGRSAQHLLEIRGLILDMPDASIAELARVFARRCHVEVSRWTMGRPPHILGLRWAPPRRRGRRGRARDRRSRSGAASA